MKLRFPFKVLIGAAILTAAARQPEAGLWHSYE
jgi:hypothetical protein